MERKRFYATGMNLMAALALCASAMTLHSCDNDDDDRINVPQELQNAFDALYQNVQRLEWETEGNYYVAEFWKDNLEKSAWFDRQFQWMMTETDLPYQQLPSAVRNAYEASQYAAWRVDDVDMVERLQAETVYVIETEQGESEASLYYTADGILVKEFSEGTGGPQGGSDYLPSTLPDEVRSFIESRYAGARIVEADMDMGYMEVDIIHERTAKEVRFDGNTYEWVSTSWDVAPNRLPQAVSDAISTNFPDYRTDDADFVETPQGNYYLIELERGNEDRYVKIAEDGSLIQ